MAANLFLNQLNATTLHPTVANWIDRVKTNGGTTLSASTVIAVNRFYQGVVNSGLSQSLLSINVFAPESLTASFTPLVVLSGSNDPWKPISGSFTASALTVNGLHGNSNVVLDTGIFPKNVFTTASAHGATYISVGDNTAVNQNDWGEADSGGANAWRLYGEDSGNRTTFSPGTNQFPQVVLTPAAITGLLVSSRTSTTNWTGSHARSDTSSMNYFLNNSVAASSTPSSTMTFYVFGSHETTGASNVIRRTLSFQSFGRGLTAAQSQTLFNLVQQLRKDMGGGWT